VALNRLADVPLGDQYAGDLAASGRARFAKRSSLKQRIADH